MNQHRTFAPKKSRLVFTAGFSKGRSTATTTVSKKPNDLVHQFQDLEELYQELLALRIRVRKAERANEKRVNISPNTKTGNPARRKQLAHKRAR
jgi:hypothetical protein